MLRRLVPALLLILLLSPTPRAADACTTFMLSRGGERVVGKSYDPVHLRVSFRTRTSRGIKTLDLGKQDPSCARPVVVVDIDADASGDVADRLRPYELSTNRALIERSVRRVRSQLPAGAVDMMIAYPSSLACQAP